MEWKYYKPVFDLDLYNSNIKNYSAWSGHRNFAYDLVRFMKPKVMVELGTYFGVSFFSFCQAAKDGAIPTKCFAVDTWKGDPHSGFYGEAVFQMVKDVVGKYYFDIATLVRSTFDQAVNKFDDQSIDILHIDGYHTYEVVAHDFENWLPKVSTNGVVLFHDISVKNNGFGVYQLWDELKNKYPAIQFDYSYGLGVLFPKGYSDVFKPLFQKSHSLQKTYEAMIGLD